MKPDSDLILTLGTWAELKSWAQPIRIEVFVREQGIDPELEWDEFDPVSLHCLARSAGRPIATGRLLPDGHIGRMAVLRSERRGGVGGRVLTQLVEAAANRGDPAVELSAQCYVEAFYRRHGFVTTGEPYLEAGIAHIRMCRVLQPGSSSTRSAT